MFVSNLIKFSIVLALFFLLFPACRTNPSAVGENSDKTSAVANEFQTTLPFAVREPERFQAEMVITSGGTERKNFIARNGFKRRLDFNFGQKNQVSQIETDKIYLILQGRKIYAESLPGEISSGADEWGGFLTTEWLSEKLSARFEKLETRGQLTVYRAVLEDSGFSEAVITIDETLQMPVKQELFSVQGEQRTVVFVWELKNINEQADDSLFNVPADFKKVSMSEWRKELAKDE